MQQSDPSTPNHDEVIITRLSSDGSVDVISTIPHDVIKRDMRINSAEVFPDNVRAQELYFRAEMSRHSHDAVPLSDAEREELDGYLNARHKAA